MALTNLTFGNASIKTFLCSFPGFVPIMVGQLQSPWENLRKATAHLFRNLAWKVYSIFYIYYIIIYYTWKADKTSKAVLSESEVVTVLMAAAMTVAERSGAELGMKEEPTLKVILSALWNLSAHCRKNKVSRCP